MKKIFLLPFTLLLICFANAQYEQDSAWFRDNYFKKESLIPMRDGVKLFTAAYIPKDVTEKHPILLLRTPYSCYPYGETSFNVAFWQRYFRYYAREGYIVVFQDV